MGLDLTPLLTSFSIIFLAELGDKTQICTIMLSSRSSARSVFPGAMAAFLIVDGLSALLGGELLSFMPKNIIDFTAGIVFITFGTLALTRKGWSRSRCNCVKLSFLKAFSLIALMELGDKTQIISIFLAAHFRSPLLVLAGVMLAFAVITGIGAFLGSKVLRVIPERFLQIGAAAVFFILGLIQVIEALFMIDLPP